MVNTIHITTTITTVITMIIITQVQGALLVDAPCTMNLEVIKRTGMSGMAPIRKKNL